MELVLLLVLFSGERVKGGERSSQIARLGSERWAGGKRVEHIGGASARPNNDEWRSKH